MMSNSETTAYMVRELNGRILSWSKGAEELYGWCTDEAVGKKDVELFGGGEKGVYAEGTEAVLRLGSWHQRLHQRARDGRSLTVESLWMILGRQLTRPTKIIVVNKDITGRSRYEQEVLYLDHLRGLGALAGGVAHDVNNLLAPILMSVDVLRRSVDGERGERVLETIKRCAERGMEVLGQLLRLATKVDGERVPIHVRHLVYELRNFIDLTSAEPIEVVADYQQDLPTIEAQPTRIFQLLMNLCFNARDSMPQGGRLTITAEAVDLDDVFCSSRPTAEPGRYVVLSVADTGAGMASDVLAKAFEPYYTTKKGENASGLGLHLVNSITRAHGGFVEAESRVGVGTTVRVYLPAQIRETTTPARDLCG